MIFILFKIMKKKDKRIIFKKKRRKKNINILFYRLIKILSSLFIFLIFSLILIKRLVSVKVNPKSNFKKSKMMNKEINIDKNLEKIKVCVCTLGKQENKYAREFVEHYKKYGVDKMYIYDNNDINGERFEEVLNDYIKSGFIEILDWRGKYLAMYPIMNDCYRKNSEFYDWLIFYEFYEFIHLSNYTNIKLFLNQTKYQKCQILYLNLVCHTDNNLLHYEDKPLFERFPYRVPNHKKGSKKLEIKFIIQGGIKNVTIDNVHRCNTKLRNCNGYGYGHRFKYNVIYTTEPDTKNYYIDHFYCKSTEEFIGKLNKGDALRMSKEYTLERIIKYFEQSDYSDEKFNMIQKNVNFDLSKYKHLYSHL